MSCPSPRRRSPWREFTFAFRQVVEAIQPRFSLAETITNWNQIVSGLAEPPRKRKLQEEIYRKTS
jgi:hypothetical protein